MFVDLGRLRHVFKCVKAKDPPWTPAVPFDGACQKSQSAASPCAALHEMTGQIAQA